MRLLDDIGDPIPQNPTCDSLTQLGDALDHAEFVERVPELQRQNAEHVFRDYGRFAVAPFSPRDRADFLDIPRHLTVSKYRTALMFAGDVAPAFATYKEAHTHYVACAEGFYARCDMRFADVEWCDGGKSVGLRAILDSQHEMVKARRALEARKDAPPPPQQYTVIDGEVFPVSKTPPRKARTRKVKS